MTSATGFEDVKIGWRGKTYVIPENRVLDCISRVEEVLTVHELMKMGQSGNIATSKITRAYAVVLRCAGCEVTDAEAYSGIFRQSFVNAEAMACIGGLLTILLPKDLTEEAVRLAEEGEAAKGKARSKRSRGKSSSS